MGSPQEQPAEGTRVVLRVRPFSAREAGTSACLQCLPGNSLQYTGPDAGQRPSYAFDRVFEPSASQAEVR